MKKQTVEFNVTTKDRVVTNIGKSYIEQPKIEYNGKPMPWFDDSKLLKKGADSNDGQGKA